MSFLTDDAKAALEEKFKAMNTEEVQPTQQETKNETQAVENSFQGKQDDKNVEVSSPNDKDEPGHAVPYQRFKEVNESKKQLKAKTAELERQLAETRAQLERKSESRNDVSHRSDLDDIIYSLENDSESNDKYSSLEKRLQTFEVRAAQAELEAEIASISRKFPEVPETVLLQAVISNPETSLVDVAREYTQFIAEIEERALAKHAKKTAPAAPPRPQSSGVPVVTTQGKPRTMADARTAALAFLKQQGL